MIKIPYGKTFLEFDEARYGAAVIESRIGDLKAEGDEGKEREGEKQPADEDAALGAVSGTGGWICHVMRGPDSDCVCGRISRRGR